MTDGGIRSRVRAARERGSVLVRVVDGLRGLGRAESRGLLWTRIAHGRALHQTSGTSWAERYPDLFDLAAELAPDARRLLSFGCSTGEELEALRRRFPKAEIVGAEINPRLRRLAAARMKDDAGASVLAPGAIEGLFDIVFALAVLQRLPDQIAARGVTDLSGTYPFERFDAAVGDLAARLRPGGLLCVMHAHYRVEDSGVAEQLAALPQSPPMSHPLFGRDSRRLPADAVARSMFRKL